MFEEIRGFLFASVLDLNMGYLSIGLTVGARKLLTIVTTFGFFECMVLPMGVKPATDIFQSRMIQLFSSMREKKPAPYIDDIFHGKGGSFDEHLDILKEILKRLLDGGMQVNLDKSELCKQTVEFVGFQLERTGYRPTSKRVDAILRIAPPKVLKNLRMFIGATNFIKNHIPNRAELMAPLTALTKKDVSWRWGEDEQSAFDVLKAAVANAILCTYPDPNKRYIIYPDAAQKYAMGAMLMQEQGEVEVCVGTFSRKFNDAQLKYPVGDQELLAAKEACNHFHDIIHGCEVIIRCDHKNITNAATQHKNLRVQRQLIELDQEYGAKFEHLPGEENVGGDALSRLEMLDDVPERAKSEVYAINELDGDANHDCPISMSLISSEQAKDEKIQEILTQSKYRSRLGTLERGGHSVVTVDGKILVPASLQQRIIRWYHTNLRHPGVTRTANSLAQNFGWRGLRAQVESYVKSCDECQRHKIVGKPNYGEVPETPPQREKDPFEKVHVDCAGPWKVKVTDGVTTEEYTIHVMTMVDAGTNWCEFRLIPTANSLSCAAALDEEWLCRYPRPTECGHDNGPEFMGEEFQEMLASYDIKSKPTTVKNPTAQSLVERLHLTLGDSLRSSIYNVDDWSKDVNQLIQACAWAIRTATPSNIPYSPGQLVFGNDMVFRQKTLVDWQQLKQLRRQQAIANNKKENKSRIPHVYSVGDMVLIVEKSYERAKKSKLSSPTEGPYEVIRVYNNGNVRIRRGNYDEDINIRCLPPYYSDN